MKFDMKTVSVVVGLVLTLSGVIYKSVTAVNATVQQVESNTENILTLAEDVKLNRLKRLHRQALSDYYYWDAQCKKSHTNNDCRERDRAKLRVKNLEQQIEELEKKRR